MAHEVTDSCSPCSGHTAKEATGTAPALHGHGPSYELLSLQTKRHLHLVFKVRVSLPAWCGSPGALWSPAPTPGAAEKVRGHSADVELSHHLCAAGGRFSAGRAPGCPDPLGLLPEDGEINPFSPLCSFPSTLGCGCHSLAQRHSLQNTESGAPTTPGRHDARPGKMEDINMCNCSQNICKGQHTHRKSFSPMQFEL